MPYKSGLDQQRLQEQIEIGGALIDSIHDRLSKRELSPSFLHDWGRFCRAAGVIDFLYFSETSVGHGRSAVAGGRAKSAHAEAHERWFAHYFLKAYERGRRKSAEKSVERLVNAIIDGAIAIPAGYDVRWFESFLRLDDPKADDYGTLRPSFNEHALSVTRMKALKAKGANGIPPVDLEFPDP